VLLGLGRIGGRPRAEAIDRLLAALVASTARSYEHRTRFYGENGSYIYRSRCGGLRSLCANQVRGKSWNASRLGNPANYDYLSLVGLSAHGNIGPWGAWVGFGAAFAVPLIALYVSRSAKKTGHGSSPNS
jgi:hypothetical protein